MNEWIGGLCDLTAGGEPAVLVTVAGIRGSAPREIGAKMIVTAEEAVGTIGGGQLEYQATRIAVEETIAGTVYWELKDEILQAEEAIRLLAEEMAKASSATAETEQLHRKLDDAVRWASAAGGLATTVAGALAP